MIMESERSRTEKVTLSKEKIYRKIQREIGLFLYTYGFEKAKSDFRKDYGEGVCIFYFHKPRNEIDEDAIAWQLLGGIWFKSLDRMFRNERDLRESEPDIHLYDGTPPASGKGISRRWLVTDSTDANRLVSELKNVMEPALRQMGEIASLKRFSGIYTNRMLEKPNELSITGLVKAAVAAHASGLHVEYESLQMAIGAHPQGDSWFVRHHLRMIKK